MSAGSGDRARDLFEHLSGIGGEARRHALQRVAETEPALAAEVASLLEHHDRTDAILDRAPGSAAAGESVAAAARSAETNGEELALPASLGAYTLLRVLGTGGMGAVYEAEQTSPRRRVAVKLVRPELASASMLRRFEHEAEALGMLDHPGIARVFEAGRGELAGHPRAFIAMELVDGVPITEFAAAQKLGQADRMRLLADVCDAIDSAHRRGVIHRDLKPANILVDRGGRPRVLDFGVARAGPAGAGVTMVTTVGQIVGTLAYMSPEQAAADAARIDSRSDVYALGAILFELLCGRPPIDVSGMSIQGALAAVQTAPPALTRLARRSLGRDVEAILLRSLEKEPARRYQHASDLADDLRRFLRNEPIIARSPSALYQLSRFCVRHRELTAAAALALATLVIAMAVVSASLVRAERALEASVASGRAAVAARDEAVAQAELATRNMHRYVAVSGFMRTLLGAVRPDIARGSDTTLLRAMLEKAEGDLHVLEERPEALADAHTLLADVYRSLGEFARSEHHGRRSLDLYRASFGEESVWTAAAMGNLGALYRGSLRRFDEAEPLLRRAVELFTLLKGAGSDDTLRSKSSLALLYMDTARYADAEPVLHDIRTHFERSAGPDSPTTLRAMHNHAGALSMLERHAEAAALARRAYEGRARVLGDDHPDTITSLLLAASCLRSLGKAGEALPLIERCVDARTAGLGATHQLTILARVHLANALRELGRLEEADSYAASAAADARSSLGEGHADALQARLAALEIRVMLGKCDGARQEAAELRDALVVALGDRAAVLLLYADAVGALADACDGGDEAAGEALARAYQGLVETSGPTSRLTRHIAAMLAEFHSKRGREEQAGLWRGRAAPPAG